MALLGYQFDKMRVDPSADALLYNYLNGNSNGVIPTYKEGMRVTALGLVLTILPGACIIEGRLIVLTEPQAITVPIDSGKILALTVDLSKVNTVTGDPIDSSYIVTNNQIKFELRDDVDASNQDLNNGGTVYSQSLGTYETQGTTAIWTPNADFYSPYTGANLFNKLARATVPYVAFTNNVLNNNWFTQVNGHAGSSLVHDMFSDAQFLAVRVGGLVTLQFRGTARAGASVNYLPMFNIMPGFGIGKTADGFGCAMTNTTTGTAPWSVYQQTNQLHVKSSGAATAGQRFSFNLTYATNDDYPNPSSFIDTNFASSGIKYPLF